MNAGSGHLKGIEAAADLRFIFIKKPSSVVMPLKETYLAAKRRPPVAGVHLIDVTPLRKGRMLSLLAPDEELTRAWSRNEIKWKEYVELYYRQIQKNEAATHLLNWIIEHSATETVWIRGLEKEYPGPRFLIIEVVDKVHSARRLIDAPRDYSDLYERYKNLTRFQITLIQKGKLIL
jgi:hypothetical protein